MYRRCRAVSREATPSKVSGAIARVEDASRRQGERVDRPGGRIRRQISVEVMIVYRTDVPAGCGGMSRNNSLPSLSLRLCAM